MDMTEKLRQLAFTPMRTQRPSATKEILNQASTEAEVVDGNKVVHYVWGEGQRRVLLVHGWSGNAGHVAVLADALVRAGCTAVIVDLPGHGESEGKESSVIHFAKAIEAANDRYGPIHAVVAHSLGAAATTYAMSRGLAVNKAVFFNPISSYTTLWRRSREVMQVPPETIAEVRARAEEWLGVKFDDIEPVTAAPGFSSELLIVHDEDDTESPVSDSEALVNAWPRAELVKVENLGHTRVLRDEGMVRRTVDFVTGAEGVLPSP
ncbi:alpha/beta hydrolase [Streptomyces zagrosensis]|uniref:Pimeloyl-ACP methyl ester carboxylesterase n=1 Tax=Streptomyces zagrosensis TaxID=1042984 RepID=A0A7W9QGM3_9ACTN|nr:alpha/beta hydrolase [Streptomyces zagrosensis]MBB5939893.1 pimeloyl-ACP methyl ester carboxylesterase [Streptomyces zagrosensis]